MIRKQFKKKQSLETEPEFRYKGTGSSRIENLSDAVFGFGVTLLIVSLNVPKSFAELKEVFDGFFAFGLCVLLFFGIWYEHYIFFIRYGLKDNLTVLLNALLLFVLLFYIYPLKFLVTLFIEALKAGYFYLTTSHTQGIFEMISTQMIAPSEMPNLMILYGLGAASLYYLFALLYRNAWRKREELELNEFEQKLTHLNFLKHLFTGSIPLLSALLAYCISSPVVASIFSGMVYSLMGGVAFFGVWEKRIKKDAGHA